MMDTEHMRRACLQQALDDQAGYDATLKQAAARYLRYSQMEGLSEDDRRFAYGVHLNLWGLAAFPPDITRRRIASLSPLHVEAAYAAIKPRPMPVDILLATDEALAQEAN